MNEYPRVILAPQRDVSVRRRHPWLFSGAIKRVEGAPKPGALVAVHSFEGMFLAWGHYSAASQIRARLFAWDERDAPETAEFWRGRLERAIAARQPLLADGTTTACRLVNAESDGIPGLVVDRYWDIVIVQYLSAGVEARRELFNGVRGTFVDPDKSWQAAEFPPVQDAAAVAADDEMADDAGLPDTMDASVVATGLVAGVAQAPDDPYFAQSLKAWEQGRFVRFHGLAQWVGWLWPYVAMGWMLSRLGTRR
jgi:hypothetical protein